MGVPSSAASRITGVDAEFKNFNTGAASGLPQRLAIIGQGNDNTEYPLNKYECQSSASAVGDIFGYGSPLHLAAKQLFPTAGKTAIFPVTIYPVKKAVASVASVGDIAITGIATAAGSGVIRIGGVDIPFSVLKNALAADIMAALRVAINSELNVPVLASAGEGKITLTAKWSGVVSNQIKLSVTSNIAGLVFIATQLTNGAGTLNVNLALPLIANVWETFVLNCGNYSDEAMLEDYFIWGDGRWGALEKKPALVAHGCTDDYVTRTAVTDLRKTDYINFLIPSVGSDELPFAVAARGLFNDIMTTADSNPAQGYKGLLTGLAAGADSVQEDYAVRNMSVMKGASTNIKNGSVAELNDIITMYHPANEGKFPSKRYVVDLVKLMYIIYNVRLIMEEDAIKGAPLVSDETITSNPAAIQPKTVKSYFAKLADSLADAAIIQEPKYTKENLAVAIDGENPKRLNTKFPVKLSGNVEITDNSILFGFYLGGA